MQEGCNLQGPLDWAPCNTPVKEPDRSIPTDDEDADYGDAGQTAISHLTLIGGSAKGTETKT